MKNYTLIVIVLSQIMTFQRFSVSLQACTVFSAATNNKILAAANKDWSNIDTRMLFLPASEGKYGRVYFGYQIPQGFQNAGGMNNQGLWYDGASLPQRSDIKNHYNKPTVKGELCEKALEECASVDEVIAMYRKYFSPHWQGHSMWADKYGNSIIVEFGEKDVIFIRRKNDYQVMTNFYVSDTTNARWLNSYRYNVAVEMFENNDITSSLFRSILNATHQTGMNPTVYSNIYDLKNGDLYIHNFHNYDEFVKINLAEQLTKGQQYFKIPALFNQINLSKPQMGAEVDPSSVTFVWYGNAQTYNLYYSENPDFVNCIPVNTLSSLINPIQASSLHLALFLLGVIAWRLKKKLIKIFFCVSLIFLSCEMDIINSPYKPSKLEHSITIEDLKPNTQYYWKIEALGENNINSESLIKSFTSN